MTAADHPKQGYEQIDVRVIPENWRSLTVAELAARKPNAIVGGPFGSDLVSNDYVPFGVPVIRGQNMTGHFVSGHFVFVSLEKAKRLAANTAAPGDIVFTQRGTLGQVALVPKGSFEFYVISQSQMKLSPDLQRFDPKYILQYFVSDFGQRKILESAIQTGVPHTNLGILKAYRLPAPPIEEQRAIAEALSDADALIESLEQLLAKKRHIKQGAMQELLTGKRRLPGFGGEWSTKRLGVCADIQRGASPRPIDNPIWFDENSSVGWVRISDVTKSGMYLVATTQRLSSLGIQHSRPVERGSLIMSICATVGRPIITMIDTCIHDGFVVFDNIHGTLKNFLFYVLTSIENDWSRHGQTGSQMNLNTGLINRTEIAMPPTLEEQEAIATILYDIDADIVTLEAKLTKARALKQGMMQELLTGRIRLV